MVKLSLEKGKKWYQSKAVWAGVVGVVISIYNVAVVAVEANFGINLPVTPEWLYTVLAAFGIHGRITANDKIN